MRILLMVGAFLVAGCGSVTVSTPAASPGVDRPAASLIAASNPEQVAATATATATATPEPSLPTATATATATPEPSLLPASTAPFAVTNHDLLPSCRYDLDLPTRLTAPSEWALTLVDALYALPVDYAPPDLVSTSSAGLGGFRIRAVALPDLAALAAAARRAGIGLGLVSTYRDYTEQAVLFRRWSAVYGADAFLGSARAGHSEHQLGLALDFTVPGSLPWDFYSFERDTPAGKWLAANAWRYGFVMSYPWKGRNVATCYGYEPWHYRFVGRAEAAAVRWSGLTLREWLWLRQPGAAPPSEAP
jgi:zinc D-Ala-D-Ala carboxypeptidase